MPAVLALFVLPANVFAQDLSQRQVSALKKIVSVADGICGPIPDSGSASSSKVGGGAKLELTELLKHLASAKVAGSTEIERGHWQGVLQKDLAELIQRTQGCRLEVFNELKSSLVLTRPSVTEPVATLSPRTLRQLCEKPAELRSANPNIGVWVGVLPFVDTTHNADVRSAPVAMRLKWANRQDGCVNWENGIDPRSSLDRDTWVHPSGDLEMLWITVAGANALAGNPLFVDSVQVVADKIRLVWGCQPFHHIGSVRISAGDYTDFHCLRTQSATATGEDTISAELVRHAVRVDRPPVVLPQGRPTVIASLMKVPPREANNPRCADIGSAGAVMDTASNLLKNRIDSAVAYGYVSIADLLALPWQGLPRFRFAWSPTDSIKIAQYESAPIDVQGYIATVRVEGRESTNCGINDQAWHDWHLALVATRGEALDRDYSHSIVVEVTPRVRAASPSSWSSEKLEQWMRKGQAVRISGWLFFDPAHPEQVGRYRGTLWEVHPVMRIEPVAGAEH